MKQKLTPEQILEAFLRGRAGRPVPQDVVARIWEAHVEFERRRAAFPTISAGELVGHILSADDFDALKAQLRELKS